MDMTNMTGPPPGPGGAGGPSTNPLFPQDTRAPLVVGIASTFIAINVVFLAVRIYIRGYLMRGWGGDDSMFAASAVSTMSFLR